MTTLEKVENGGAGYHGKIGAVGASTLIASSISQVLSFTNEIGKGLSEPCEPFRIANVFGAEMNAPDASNWNCLPEMVEPNRLFNLSTLTSYHEVAVALSSLFNLPAGQSYNVWHNWCRTSDNKQLFLFNYSFPDPADYGYDEWEWCYVYSYVGYFPWEIWDNDAYYLRVSLDYGGSSESERLDFVIEGLRRELMEGKAYPVNLKVKNISTGAGGIFVPATLDVGVRANTPSTALIPEEVRSESFLQNEERLFQYELEVPIEIFSEEGSVRAWVNSPQGATLGVAERVILLQRKPLVLSISYYDNKWYSFTPEVVNQVTANNPDVWVSAELSGCIPGKSYRLVVTTPRQTFSNSVIANSTKPIIQLNAPTGGAGLELWTLQLYDAYEGNYMFWEYSYNMDIVALVVSVRIKNPPAGGEIWAINIHSNDMTAQRNSGNLRITGMVVHEGLSLYWFPAYVSAVVAKEDLTILWQVDSVPGNEWLDFYNPDAVIPGFGDYYLNCSTGLFEKV